MSERLFDASTDGERLSEYFSFVESRLDREETLAAHALGSEPLVAQHVKHIEQVLLPGFIAFIEAKPKAAAADALSPIARRYIAVFEPTSTSADGVAAAETRSIFRLVLRAGLAGQSCALAAVLDGCRTDCRAATRKFAAHARRLGSDAANQALC